MSARVRAGNERENGSTITSAHAAPLVSPLQISFDFELEPKPFTTQSLHRISDDSLRPKTSDGVAASELGKSRISVQPPVLPPIPRVASRYENSGRVAPQESRPAMPSGPSRQESDNVSAFSANSRNTKPLNAKMSYDNLDMMPTLSGPHSYGFDMAGTSGSSSPRMESSLFPKAGPSLTLPPINSGPPMSRAFIDSRDKPYSMQASRPAPLETSLSSPVMPTLQPPSLAQSSFPIQRPSSAVSMTPSTASLRAPKISGARLSPNSSVEDLRATLQQAPPSTTRDYLGTAASNYSGTTARPSTHASASPSATIPLRSPLQQSHSTIGTPYQATSSAFPLPQHVATRPKTAGATASVAGVNVPTHHTSAMRPEPPKLEKRKTRLLNPMSLLARRRSGQDGDADTAERTAERSAAAQAYARQKSVAAVGLRNLPEDFDPRIRGKVVHDFSAPRAPRRNHSYNDAVGQSPDGWLPSPDSVPSLPTLREDLVPDQQSLAHSKQPTDTSSAGARRSVHSPVFREMLTEEPDMGKRVSSLNAERLENRGFLQRMSHHSSNSTFSQESAVLPPFARRSQILDPMQAALYADDESKRSSDPSSHKQRDSDPSSVSSLSPTVGRNSNPNVLNSLGINMSPVSSSSSEKDNRPMSDLSAKAAPISPEVTGKSHGGFTARPYSTVLTQAAIETIAENPDSPTVPERSPHRDSSMAPEALVIPNRNSSLAPELSNPYLSMPGTSPSIITPEKTPEIVMAESFMAARAPQGSAKVVEKRASAVGHAKRVSLTPKHHVSNASRFSFQFGESAAQEHALEEKHRQTVSSADGSAQVPRQASPDDDEDDFDEDAMDDMDELEAQGQHDPEIASMGDARASKFMRVQHPPPQVQLADSSEGSVYDDDEEEQSEAEVARNPADEREVTYAEHEAFRAHSAMASAHSKTPSAQASNWGAVGSEQPTVRQRPSEVAKHQRITSDASILTLDTDVMKGPGAGNANFLQDHFSAQESLPGGVGGARPRSGFYMQPRAAGYSPSASPLNERPPLPHRDSGNSERNRAASGMSFGSAEGPLKSPSALGNSIDARTKPHAQRITSQSTLGGSSSSEPRTISTGLGLSDFNFNDSLNHGAGDSRPMSLDTNEKLDTNRLTKDSETIPTSAGWADLERYVSKETPPPQDKRKSSYFSSTSNDSAAYRGNIGQNIRARNAAVDQNRQYAASDSGEDGAHDDMYFDDGGFEHDINTSRHNRNDSIDENEFDNESYQRGKAFRMSQQRDMGSMALNSLGADGPYPTFAMGANPVLARQRQSQLLLEDLPLAGPVDPKLIPQRNPSEDAKRLGLSSRVPPLPPQPGSKEAEMRTRASLQAYHNTLAEALNRAAAEGRFVRQPSINTARSVSVYSNGANSDKNGVQGDDRSHYSQEDDATNHPTNGSQYLMVDQGLKRSLSQETSGSKMDQSQTYSPPKMSFDFGFDNLDTGDNGVQDDYEQDDDMIAAANAEVLADDDDGFYGQEFGFYANARPNSSDAQAVNGGFFGPDGDDGLARNKSLKEPNLTPITERSEFSTRNSFINLGYGTAFGMPSAAGTFGPVSPALARLPTSPLAEGGVTSFDQLRKLRGNAFGGSNGSLRSDSSKGPLGPGAGISAWQQAAAQSPNVSSRSLATGSGYFGAMGGAPMAFGYSTESSGSSNPSSGQVAGPVYANNHFHDSPQSASSSHIPFPAGGGDIDATPRKGQVGFEQRKAPAGPQAAVAPATANSPSHARKGSDSVTYVREPDPAGKGQPRWVLERRRTSEQGQLELVGREVVHGGWI